MKDRLRDFHHLSLPDFPGTFNTSEWKGMGTFGSLYNYAPIELAASGLFGPGKFVLRGARIFRHYPKEREWCQSCGSSVCWVSHQEDRLPQTCKDDVWGKTSRQLVLRPRLGTLPSEVSRKGGVRCCVRRPRLRKKGAYQTSRRPVLARYVADIRHGSVVFLQPQHSNHGQLRILVRFSDRRRSRLPGSQIAKRIQVLSSYVRESWS
ncbi:uncharacterized protein [Macrobrachium rosenbergii]|uniref:uncharacterized protein isoform X2 n=1 Tax=Macrobrachium rosenbergii TaxID=79674 RepID=UPI0034D6F06C